MGDRDDANLKQFASRAQQPKILSAGPVNPSPVNVFVVFDQGFGGVSDQVDGTRFRYTGTSPQMSQYEKMSSGKQTLFASMRGYL